MNTTAIDLDMLNELLENQKKLDDIAFDLSFEDDLFLSDFPAPDKQKATYKSTYSVEDTPLDIPKTHSLAYFVVPVSAEIAAISYSIIHFT